jgi:hypothetical protein
MVLLRNSHIGVLLSPSEHGRKRIFNYVCKKKFEMPSKM